MILPGRLERGAALRKKDEGVTDHERSGSTFAHELGHTMGLNHDRYAATRCPRCSDPPEQDLRKWKPYPYAFGYVNQRALEPDAPESSRWVTIMAYRAVALPAQAVEGHLQTGAAHGCRQRGERPRDGPAPSLIGAEPWSASPIDCRSASHSPRDLHRRATLAVPLGEARADRVRRWPSGRVTSASTRDVPGRRRVPDLVFQNRQPITQCRVRTVDARGALRRADPHDADSRRRFNPAPASSPASNSTDTTGSAGTVSGR